MIRVALADDEELITSSLSTLIDLEEDLCVVHKCHSGEELVQWCRAHEQAPALDEPDGRTGSTVTAVDVCVVDLRMTGIDGVQTAQQLLTSPQAPAVLIVTSHGRPRELKRALAAGVSGFMPKTASADEFAQAIRTVYAGRRYVDPELAALAIGGENSPLTGRETELLTLVGTGKSIDEIAAAMHLAPGTTRNYLSTVMSKVGAQNRFEAFARAKEAGWVD